MLNGKSQIFSKRRSGSEAQNFTKIFLCSLVHIRREKDTRLLTVDFLPEELTERLQNFFNGNTVFLINFGEQYKIISKKMGARRRGHLMKL